MVIFKLKPNIIDLTHIPQLKEFPWESVYHGLALAEKTITTFYGDEHSTKWRSTESIGWPSKNAWRWYNAIKHGASVEGFNVNLNTFLGPNWWARAHEPIWKPLPNMNHFQELQKWIINSNIFESTGRQLFFVQLENQSSPNHVDFNIENTPGELSNPSDFLWLTPPENPKKFLIDGVQAPWACWFNHFVSHGTKPSDKLQWSLRIDGIFNSAFKTEFIQRA